MGTNTASKRPAPPAVDKNLLHLLPPASPTHDEIATRAYARYLNRGMEAGLDVTDWLAAEQDIQRELDGRKPVAKA